MGKFKNAMLGAVSAMAGLVSMSGVALAQGAPAGGNGFSGFVSGIQTQFASGVTLIGIVAFAAGLLFVLLSLMKFRAHSANPQDPSNKLSTCFIYLFVGAAMIAVPHVAGIGVGTLFGTSASMTSGTGGGMTVGIK